MKIDIVIVTYNRLEKLINALNSFENQTKLPGKIVIVDNNSTDGTKQFLEEWKLKKSKYEKVVISLEKNTGGSGGFYEGTKYLLENGSEWIWVSDDDAYPEKQALEISYNYIENNNMKNVSAICGQVIKNGITDYVHRKTIKEDRLILKTKFSTKKDYLKDIFEINIFSYVGTILSAEKLRQAGLINKNFFIYQDDSDHSIRMSKVGKIMCVPKIKIVHDVTDDNINKSDYTWKTYYLLRNKLYFYKFNFKARYYKLEKILTYLRIIKKHNKECTKLILSAINDFNNGKMGISNTYKPDWKLKRFVERK